MCVCVCAAVRSLAYTLNWLMRVVTHWEIERRRPKRERVKWKTDALKKLSKKNRIRSWKIVFQAFDGMKRIYLCVALTVRVSVWVLGLNDKWTSTLLFRDSVPWQTENVSCQPLSYYISKTRIYHSIYSSIRIRLRTNTHTRSKFLSRICFSALYVERWPRCAQLTHVLNHILTIVREKKSYRSDVFCTISSHV